jgi:NAD(P)-dependent dehydrogenase (short-subunit alcohol dehydrogenase family)
MNGSVLIVGVGLGLSTSLAKLFFSKGMTVCLAARNIEKLDDLKKITDASLIQCDASDPKQVQNLFETVDKKIGTPDIVIYNPSARVPGPITTIDPQETKRALEVTCYGGFLVAQQAANRMLARGSGSIFFTSASAAVKGFPQSSVFAMGKFGLRGLAQSLARELHPQNIHIGHFVIDGGISADHKQGRQDDGSDRWLNPDEIAKSYLAFHEQHRSSWSWEIELRPWVENF